MYVGDTFGGASTLWQNDQNERRRALQESFNAMLIARQRQQELAQQGSQFQQQLHQNYALSDAALQRQALLNAMNSQYRSAGLDLREQSLKQQSDKINDAEANHKKAQRFAEAQAEVEAGTFDPKNYADLDPEQVGFLTRQSALPAQRYAAESDVAASGNRLNKLNQDVAAPVLPTSGRRWWNPLTWINQTPEVSQPSEHALAVRAALAQSLAPQLDPSAGLVNKGVSGYYVPQSPRPMNLRFVPQLPVPTAGLPTPNTFGYPKAAAAALVANPSLAGQFDAKYGAGASKSVFDQM